MLYYRINNKSYIERVIFVREPNTEEMTMSKFYAAVGGDLSDVLERLVRGAIDKLLVATEDRLQTVVKTAQAESERLMQSLKNGDLQSAFRAAHTLKGIGYNLGLNRLGDRAAALCEVLHTGSVPAPELLRQLTEEYCCVIDAIHELKSEI